MKRASIVGPFFGLLMYLAVMPLSAQSQVAGLTPMDEAAPEFDLMDTEGMRHQLSDYRGRVVIVNFWATWCPPCVAEMPSMQRAWEQLEPEGILMLGINTGESKAAIERFDSKYPVDFPLLIDPQSTATDEWPVRGMPTTFVIDTEGNFAYRAVGAREWDAPHLIDAVRALKAP